MIELFKPNHPELTSDYGANSVGSQCHLCILDVEFSFALTNASIRLEAEVVPIEIASKSTVPEFEIPLSLRFKLH